MKRKKHGLAPKPCALILSLAAAVATLAPARARAQESSGFPTPLPAVMDAVAVPGRPFDITYNWADGVPPSDYGVFVHFVDAGGRIVYQDDHAPDANESYVHHLNIPAGMPYGAYKVVIGLHNDDGRPSLPTETDGEGRPLTPVSGTRSYEIGDIVVSPAKVDEQKGEVIDLATYEAPVTNAEGQVELKRAIPDDDVDDTLVIRAALNQLSKGGTLLFPPGTYLHDDIIVSNHSNVTIKGHGATLAATNQDQGVFALRGAESADGSFAPVENVKIEGLAFTSPNSTARSQKWTSSAVHVSGGRNIELDRVRVHKTLNGKGAGAAASGAGVFIDQTDGFYIHDSVVEDTRADGYHTSNRSRNGLIFNNVSRRTGDDNFAVVSYLRQNGVVENVTVQRNNADGNIHGRGITVVGGDRIRLLDNYIHHTRSAGLLCVSEGAYKTARPTNIDILRNTLHRVNYDGHVDPATGRIYMMKMTQVMPDGTTRPIKRIDRDDPEQVKRMVLDEEFSVAPNATDDLEENVVSHGAMLISGRTETDPETGEVIAVHLAENINVEDNTIDETIHGSGHINVRGPETAGICIARNAITDTPATRRKPVNVTTPEDQFISTSNTYTQKPQAPEAGPAETTTLPTTGAIGLSRAGSAE